MSDMYDINLTLSSPGLVHVPWKTVNEMSNFMYTVQMKSLIFCPVKNNNKKRITSNS